MKLTERIKQWWKQLNCDHLCADLLMWRLHEDPLIGSYVIARYKCIDCGREFVVYITDSIEVEQWLKTMGEFKKVERKYYQ